MSDNSIDTTLLVSAFNADKHLESFYNNLKLVEGKIQILVIDDYSSDDTLYNFSDKFKGFLFFNILKNTHSKGFANALNFGISNINTKFILRMDVDDTMTKDRYSKLKSFIINKKLNFCGSAYNSVDSEGMVLSKRFFPNKHNQIKNNFHRGYFGAGGGLIMGYTSCFKNLKFNQELVPSEEFDFFIRAIEFGYKLGNVNDVLYNYLYNDESLSNKDDNIILRVDNYHKILKTHNIDLSSLRFNIIKNYYLKKNKGLLTFIDICLFVLFRKIPKFNFF